MFPATKPRLPILHRPDAAETSIRTILAANPKIIYSGHGGPFSPGRYGTGTVRRIETANDKREAILETALVLFTERGFYGTPTAMISREAGVTTGTLFSILRQKRS